MFSMRDNCLQRAAGQKGREPGHSKSSTASYTQGSLKKQREQLHVSGTGKMFATIIMIYQLA